MTVSSTSSRVVYDGNGVATVFPFAFKVNAAADLVVVFTDSTGSDVILSASQYGATGFGEDAGGSVTYPLGGAPIANGTRLTIYRDVAVTQPTSISNQGAMWPQVIEAALDRGVYILQRLADSVSRSLVVSPTDAATLDPLPNATQRAGSLLGFDADGQPYAARGFTGGASASSWLIQNFFPKASGDAALAALGGAAAAGDNSFSGTNDFAQSPTAPTPAYSDNSTALATTAYVRLQVPAGLGPLPWLDSAAPAGWVMATNRTIGNAASGATERANADTWPLFEILWRVYSDTLLPIQTSTGAASTRGASAATDYAAGKRIPLLDARERLLLGMGTMGGTTAPGRVTVAVSSVDASVQGAAGGAELHTSKASTDLNNYTINGSLNQANLPSHKHDVAVLPPVLVLPFIYKL